MVKRIAVIGPSYTGKSNLVQKYMRQPFSASYISSFIAEPRTDMHGNVIWDTPGGTRWSDERTKALKYAKGIVLCFTPSRPETFYEAINMLNDKPCVIAATKADLSPFHIKKEWSKVAADRGIKIIKVSSKNGMGIFQTFREILSITEEDKIQLSENDYQLSSCIYNGLYSYIYDVDTNNT